jgi:hypothetical protein
MKGLTSKRFWDVRFVGSVIKDRDKATVYALCVVQCLRNERTFPIHALSLAGDFLSSKSPVIDLRANAEDMSRCIETVKHPAGPSFRGQPFDVSIQAGFNAVVPQSFRQAENTFSMHIRIMAVADKHFRLRHGFSYLSLNVYDWGHVEYPQN